MFLQPLGLPLPLPLLLLSSPLLAFSSAFCLSLFFLALVPCPRICRLPQVTAQRQSGTDERYLTHLTCPDLHSTASLGRKTDGCGCSAWHSARQLFSVPSLCPRAQTSRAAQPIRAAQELQLLMPFRAASGAQAHRMPWGSPQARRRRLDAQAEPSKHGGGAAVLLSLLSLLVWDLTRCVPWDCCYFP